MRAVGSRATYLAVAGLVGRSVAAATWAWGWLALWWQSFAIPVQPDAAVLRMNTVAWLGREEGLPSGGATCMVQSQEGYLWFGTTMGLARFDGVGFRVFTPANTPELPSPGIVNAHRDHRGRLWFSTYRGVASYHAGRWTRHGPEDGWTTDYARTFAESPDGTLYVTGFDGKVLRRSGGRFEELPAVPNPSEGALGHCDHAGRLWLVKDGFIGFWRDGRWSAMEGVLEGDGPSTGRDGKLELGAGPARDGRLWVVRGNQLIKLDGSGTMVRVVLDRTVDGFWSLHEDRRGDVWITSHRRHAYHVRIEGGEIGRRPAQGRVTVMDHVAGQRLQATTFAGEDDEGNLWLGTAVNGIARWRPKVFQVVGEEEGLRDANFRSLSMDPRGRLWALAYGAGVFRSDAPLGPDPVFRPWGGLAAAESESVWADQGGRVWATRLGLGSPVVQLDEGDARVMYTGDGPKRSRLALFEDSQGVLWVGGGSETLSHQEGRWIQHAVPRVAAFAEDAAGGVLWAGGGHGLHRWDGKGFVEVRDQAGSRLPTVNSLHFVRGKGLWIAARGEGLLLRREDGSVGRIGVDQGLPLPELALVYSDGTGLLWLGGDKGIACMAEGEALRVASGDAPRVHARLFGPHDGMPRNCHLLYARQPAVARGADGRLWFPTSAGIVHVNPLDIRRDPRPPRVLPGTLTYLNQAGSPVEVGWEFGQAIVLPPGARALRLDFAALAFAAPHRVTTRVRLHLDRRVIATRVSQDRSVTWDLLPPGRYAFDIAAANESGVWSGVSAPVTLLVQPHLWQTTWFRLAALGSLMGGVVVGAAFWIRHHRMASRLAVAEHEHRAAQDRAAAAEALRRSEALRQKAEAEAEARHIRESVVRDLHDGIGGLASNLKMTVSMALATGDAHRQRRLLCALEALVDETVSEVRGMMDAMEPDVVGVQCLLDAFRRHGRKILDPHGIHLEVYLDGDSGGALSGWPIPSPECVRILKEALGAVVQYMRATRVAVRLALLESGSMLVIDSEGVVLAPETSGGRGLDAMRCCIERQGGRMDMPPGAGVRVTFQLLHARGPDPLTWTRAARGTLGTHEAGVS